MIGLETYREQNPFFLAPMAGVTDKPFRSFMREFVENNICLKF